MMLEILNTLEEVAAIELQITTIKAERKKGRRRAAALLKKLTSSKVKPSKILKLRVELDKAILSIHRQAGQLKALKSQRRPLLDELTIIAQGEEFDEIVDAFTQRQILELLGQYEQAAA